MLFEAGDKVRIISQTATKIYIRQRITLDYTRRDLRAETLADAAVLIYCPGCALPNH